MMNPSFKTLPFQVRALLQRLQNAINTIDSWARGIYGGLQSLQCPVTQMTRSFVNSLNKAGGESLGTGEIRLRPHRHRRLPFSLGYDKKCVCPLFLGLPVGLGIGVFSRGSPLPATPNNPKSCRSQYNQK